MKNKTEIGYKITLGGWRVEKGVELGLEGIEREGLVEVGWKQKEFGCEKFLFFKFFKNFYKNS